jgi:hypothetical protein
MHVQSERVDMYYVRSQLAYGQPVSRQKKKRYAYPPSVHKYKIF